MVEFYGGDLAGIESKLDYLADLGVNALNINPIFQAFSDHRCYARGCMPWDEARWNPALRAFY